jgi:hypothetical protein
VRPDSKFEIALRQKVISVNNLAPSKPSFYSDDSFNLFKREHYSQKEAA